MPNSFENINVQEDNPSVHGGSKKDIDTNNLEQQKRDRYRQDTKHRGLLTNWVIWTVSLWLLAVIVLVYLCADYTWFFSLSDEVMVALLVTTTANVLGLAFIVLKGLFNVRS